VRACLVRSVSDAIKDTHRTSSQQRALMDHCRSQDQHGAQPWGRLAPSVRACRHDELKRMPWKSWAVLGVHGGTRYVAEQDRGAGAVEPRESVAHRFRDVRGVRGSRPCAARAFVNSSDSQLHPAIRPLRSERRRHARARSLPEEHAGGVRLPSLLQPHFAWTVRLLGDAGPARVANPAGRIGPSRPSLRHGRILRKQQTLNFFPLPHGQGVFRPTPRMFRTASAIPATPCVLASPGQTALCPVTNSCARSR
jgi:hypothetical protein